ncbi:serine O-acetyltransferase EpsC [Tenacibaculum sp. SG-28]|uniref:serine O-acetyltransferase EpsC n=1 Tax=Tenacibaculum sp. SG-28 TaxID=754426 RepID=UPI000CF37DBB|nr:serine O-acetyltransferase EpsC [Tenacibaculum sp. SG-28]PQJ22876.1 serine acetyltransferase [Tenacibaculum sp. SG-28]
MKFKNFDLSLKDDVASFTSALLNHLFKSAIASDTATLEKQFVSILEILEVSNRGGIWTAYKRELYTIRMMLDKDAKAFLNSDPACKSLQEVYLAYPGFHAIAIYRLSHFLYQKSIPILPRMMSEYAHSTTGADIHPGAVIGTSFFIDHATGIVIGETTVIENNVKIFQGVTLGGIQVKKELATVKRHPTIKSNVTIYANATILGGDVVIGKDCIIGANVCIVNSIERGTIVTCEYENKLTLRKSYAV